MAIKYATRYHSDDDPGGLIREVVEMGDDFPGPAKDIILSWVIRLEPGREAAEAAGNILRDYGLEGQPDPKGACGEVVAMVREIALYGPERLRNFSPSSPRHGRRSRRRGGQAETNGPDSGT